MNNETKKKIIIAVSSLLVVALLAVIIYALIVVNNQKEEELKNDILNFLNDEYKNTLVSNLSVTYGLLNYNFSNLNTTITTSFLNDTNFLVNNEMTDEVLNRIYQSKYGMNKTQYESQANFMRYPHLNCYYHQNVLKDSKYDCDNFCSKSMQYKINGLIELYSGSDNITEEEVNTYCKKNAIYSPFEDESIIDLNSLRTLFNKITGVDIIFDNEITSNEYYNYGAYVTKNINSIKDGIKEITEITSVKDGKDNVKALYKATTVNNNELEGTVTLKKNNESYYIIANEINTAYSL